MICNDFFYLPNPNPQSFHIIGTNIFPRANDLQRLPQMLRVEIMKYIHILSAIMVLTAIMKIEQNNQTQPHK